jgi:hypothetical protein
MKTAQGSRIVSLRITDDLLGQIEADMVRRDKSSNLIGEGTLSEWIRQACVDKLNKTARSAGRQHRCSSLKERCV